MRLFNKEHERFRSRLRQWVEVNLTPNADAWERDGGFPRSLFAHLADQGLLGLTHERAYGGSELDFGYDVVLAEELPRCKMMGLCLSVIAQTNIFPPLLARLGTAEQKREFLAPAIAGTKIGCVASTEPTGGSDIVRSIQCSARDDGDAWIIDGEKKFITNAPIADFVIVLVRTRPERSLTSLSLVIVPVETPGFRVLQTLDKLGMRTSPTGWIQFDHCRVAKDLTLGKPNLGYFYVARNILEERLIGGASSVSLAALALNDTIAFIKRRAAFGTTLSQLQSIRHEVSDLAADVEMSRRFVYSLCESYSNGTVEEKEICMVKFLVFETVQRVVGRCLQLHGGSGFLEDNWLSRAYRDVRVLSIGGGASELMRDLVAAYLRL